MIKQTPKLLYTRPDTSMPEQMLNIITMAYVIEQQGYAGMVTNALFMLTLEDYNFCTTVLLTYSCLFRIGRDGWELFCRQIDIDGRLLVSQNYFGGYLAMVGDNIVAIAADEAQVGELWSEKQGKADPLQGFALIQFAWAA